MKIRYAGISLVEMMATVAVLGGVIAALVNFFPRISTFVRHFQGQQAAQTEAASAMDTMVRTLRLGKAPSVEICSCNQNECHIVWHPDPPPYCDPATANVPANSHIDFFTQDNAFHAFYWENGDLKHWNRDRFNNSVISTLAHNVTNVSFSGHPEDMSVITIALEVSVVTDAGNPATNRTLTLPAQSVRMVNTH